MQLFAQIAGEEEEGRENARA